MTRRKNLYSSTVPGYGMIYIYMMILQYCTVYVRYDTVDGIHSGTYHTSYRTCRGIMMCNTVYPYVRYNLNI